MNLLHDTMIEMGINSNMLKMFSSTGAVIDPRQLPPFQLSEVGVVYLWINGIGVDH